MFDYFLKRKKQEPDSIQKVSITYLVDNNNVPTIDVVLNSYDDDCIKALCLLLDILSKDSCYVETVQMISENLALHDREDLLIKLLTHISNQKNTKITTFMDQEKQSEVCISPIDTVI